MRLFIAIPTTKEVNKDIESELKDTQNIMKGEDVKYIPPNKWHFTLIFLGEQNKSAVSKITSAIEDSLEFLEPININFEYIKYPPGRDPRMIWATTDEDSSRRLESMKGALTESLNHHGVKWNRDKRSFKGHITLARFNFNDIETKDIKKEIDVNYQSPSIQLIKSELTKNGSKYTVLEEFTLQNQ